MTIEIGLFLSNEKTATVDLARFQNSIDDEIVSIFRSKGLPQSFERTRSASEGKLGMPDAIKWIMEYPDEMRMALQIILPLSRQLYQFIRSFGQSSQIHITVSGKKIEISDHYESLEALEEDIKREFSSN